MSTIPLPHAAIVNSIQATQPFQPGDILLIQSATTQANIPVLVLAISKLNPAQFTIDTSTDPDIININSAVISADPAWTPFTPVVEPTAGTLTTTLLSARQLVKGKTATINIYWEGFCDVTAPFTIIFAGIPTFKGPEFVALSVSILTNSGSTIADKITLARDGAVAVQGTIPFPLAPETLKMSISGTFEIA